MDIYFYSDQPTTCPKCGTRTEIFLEMENIEHIQLHKCPSVQCSYEFLIEDDLEYSF